MLGLGSGIGALYFALSEASTRCATLGKRRMGLEVRTTACRAEEGVLAGIRRDIEGAAHTPSIVDSQGNVWPAASPPWRRFAYSSNWQVAQRRFDMLEAASKEMIWFEGSGHWLFVSDADRFNRLMADKVLAEETRVR